MAEKDKKLIFIDFDNVLLDTRSFSREWMGAFVACGVLPEDFKETYASATEARVAYDIARHFAVLKEKYPALDLADLEKRLDGVRAIAHRFVFSDSISFLERMSGVCNFELLTSGVEHHQQKKIKGSGLGHHLGRVHIVPPGGKKSEAIAVRLATSDTKDFVFIDDLKENIDDVKESFPSSRVIQLLRFKNQIRSDAADAYPKNLSDVISLLDENQN